MVFCNRVGDVGLSPFYRVTILILIDGFLQFIMQKEEFLIELVTILILIDGFLQYHLLIQKNGFGISHNPYFNRWFSAIQNMGFTSPLLHSHNPYFNRWFSAI